jgi:hypothetical protein
VFLRERVQLKNVVLAERWASTARGARRALGGLLVLLVVSPLYRLVGSAAAGPAAEQALRLGRQYFFAGWVGIVLGALLILVLSLVLRGTRLAPLADIVERRLVRAPALGVGIGLGVLAAGLSLVISGVALNRLPVLLDGATQLIQARYFAAGRIAGPALPDAAFWEFQFMMPTPAGWASQYPPGFPLLLAAGLRAGAVWLAGPLALGVAVCLTTLVADRFFPNDRWTARLGAALMAVSYYLAFHAGSYMNHALAAALVALALYASLRARDGRWWWALVSGAAVGALFATRPLVGVVLGFFATVVVWASAPDVGRLSPRDAMGRLVPAACGAAPFVIGLMRYNAKLFGSPFRFGYVAVAGSAHGLGLHTDPFGSVYGLGQAIGYTAADLLGMSLDLLQTPLPIVVLIGLYLMLVPKLGRGVGLAAAWALLPVAANAVYWHHDLFMGPRLLYEAAPGWCLLAAAAVLHVIRAVPATPPPRRQGANRGLPVQLVTRNGVALTGVLVLGAGVVASGPARVRGQGASGRASGVTLAPPAVDRPTLVFVHEDWESRLGARLAALGVRVDSIRAALRETTTCQLDRLVGAWERRAAGDSTPPAVQPPRPQTSSRGPYRDVRMPSGSVVRTYPGEVLTPECEREAASDYQSVLILAPLLWQGDLPGLGDHGAMYVRDLGPERNARLIAEYPERQPAMLIRTRRDELQLIPYARGMEERWKAR